MPCSKPSDKVLPGVEELMINRHGSDHCCQVVGRSEEGKLAPHAVHGLGKLVHDVRVLLILPDLIKISLQRKPDLGESSVGIGLLERNTVPVGNNNPLGVVGERREQSTRDLPGRSEKNGSHGALLTAVGTSDEGSVGHDDKATIVVVGSTVGESADFDTVGTLLVHHRWEGLVWSDVVLIEDRDGERSVGGKLGESAVGSVELAESHAVVLVDAEARQVEERHCCDAEMNLRSGDGVS